MKTADNSLQIGSILENRYHIESILGIGGFGITYKAHDDTLDCTVVIKEYLPEECGARDGDSISVIPRTNREDDYHYGLEKYLEEARVLAKFKNPNIVKVTNFIKANGTAYIIMDFEDGIALDEWLKKKSQSFDEKTILQIIVPVLKGLAEVHKAGLLHRDIKPGNIFLRKEGGPLLIDFGAARQALGEHSKSISAIISMGYAPPEQYTTRGKQAPYTDLYAVGAVLYKLIVGNTPIESPDRSHAKAEDEVDPLTPASEAGKGKVSDWLLEITDQLLNISVKQRPQTAEAVLNAIQNQSSIESDSEAPAQAQAHADNKTRVVKSSERFAKKTSQKPAADQKPAGKQKSSPFGKVAAIFVIVAALAGTGFYAWQAKLFGGLAEGQAILYVDSQPEGADVFIGEYKIGTTPYKGRNLPAGQHNMKVSHPDFKDESKTLGLADNVISKEQFKLKPATGGLSILTTPEGASIYIDGVDTYKTTPATLADVKAGSRALKLHKDKYYDIETVVNVLKGETQRSEHTLKGGNLVQYDGQWVTPEKQQSILAEIKRKAAEAEQAARDAEARRVAKLKAERKARQAKKAQQRREAIARVGTKVKQELRKGGFTDVSKKSRQVIKTRQIEKAYDGRSADGIGEKGEAGANGEGAENIELEFMQADLADVKQKNKALIIGYVGNKSVRYLVNTNKPIEISSIGAQGGNGGAGGKGRDGSKGRDGRRGRNATAYSSGGNGGRGGNGTAGGKGASGGKGGKGGNGGNITVKVFGESVFEKNIKIKAFAYGGSGGKGGEGGSGGTGGAGGAGGAGGKSYSRPARKSCGYQGSGSDRVYKCRTTSEAIYKSGGYKGSSGSRGRDGANGNRGSDGKQGNRGVIRIIKSSK